MSLVLFLFKYYVDSLGFRKLWIREEVTIGSDGLG